MKILKHLKCYFEEGKTSTLFDGRKMGNLVTCQPTKWTGAITICTNLKGGSFKNYSKKEYQVLTDEVISRHLQGTETIGIYPLLEDNTSFFIAADFDDNNWRDSIQKLYTVCRKYEIPAYIERSRSGNGGITLRR